MPGFRESTMEGELPLLADPRSRNRLHDAVAEVRSLIAHSCPSTKSSHHRLDPTQPTPALVLCAQIRAAPTPHRFRRRAFQTHSPAHRPTPSIPSLPPD